MLRAVHPVVLRFMLASVVDIAQPEIQGRLVRLKQTSVCERVLYGFGI